MNEVKRAYIEGDQVIARRALVSSPVEARGVGVEIPSGTPGVVVAVRDPEFQKPYIAVFDIGDLEICVDEDDIGLLYPASYVSEPDPVATTFSQDVVAHLPHRRCRETHMAQTMLMCAGLVISLYQQTFAVGLVMALLAVFALVMFFIGRPRSRDKELPDCMTLRVDEQWAYRALWTDIYFIWAVAGCLGLLLAQSLTGLYLSAPEFLGGSVFYPAVGVAIVAWAAKEVAHHRATYIVDSCVD